MNLDEYKLDNPYRKSTKEEVRECDECTDFIFYSELYRPFKGSTTLLCSRCLRNFFDVDPSPTFLKISRYLKARGEFSIESIESELESRIKTAKN